MSETASRALPVQDARIYPRGGLDVLSRAEVARLRDASAGGMHELLRRFAAEKLAAQNEAEYLASQAHSAYYLEWVAQQEGALHGRQARRAIAAAFARICLWYSRNSGVIASFSATALAAMTCMSGPPWIPGKIEELSFFAISSRQRIIPARGPRSVLCVVVVTNSQ